jgi:hypothetical protein
MSTMASPKDGQKSGVQSSVDDVVSVAPADFRTWFMPMLGVAIALGVFATSVVLVVVAHHGGPASSRATTSKPNFVVDLQQLSGNKIVISAFRQDAPYSVNMSKAPPTLTKSRSALLNTPAYGVSVIHVGNKLLDVVFGVDTSALVDANTNQPPATLAQCQSDAGQSQPSADAGQNKLNAPGLTLNVDKHLCLIFSRTSNLAFLTVNAVSGNRAWLDIEQVDG